MTDLKNVKPGDHIVLGGLFTMPACGEVDSITDKGILMFSIYDGKRSARSSRYDKRDVVFCGSHDAAVALAAALTLKHKQVAEARNAAADRARLDLQEIVDDANGKPMAERIGDSFANLLRAALTREQFAEMRKLNATEPYKGGSCASQNYLDANVTMDEAFCSHVGRHLDVGSDADTDLWNAAWAHARKAHLEDAVK